MNRTSTLCQSLQANVESGGVRSMPQPTRGFSAAPVLRSFESTLRDPLNTAHCGFPVPCVPCLTTIGPPLRDPFPGSVARKSSACSPPRTARTGQPLLFIRELCISAAKSTLQKPRFGDFYKSAKDFGSRIRQNRAQPQRKRPRDPSTRLCENRKTQPQHRADTLKSTKKSTASNCT